MQVVQAKIKRRKKFSNDATNLVGAQDGTGDEEEANDLDGHEESK